ncbi:MAG: PIN domain-containing protein [Phycisphaeraceae bacterium]|nr:PIN domain-containing protein [Phycisphaeraceae bacterium]
MTATLIDTDVFSLMFKGDTRTRRLAGLVEGTRVCLALMSVAELGLWAMHRQWGPSRRRDLSRAIEKCVVLQPDLQPAEVWASITAHRRRLGRPLSCSDAWIAATALRFGLPFLTRNTKDFHDIPGLALLDIGRG